MAIFILKYWIIFTALFKYCLSVATPDDNCIPSNLCLCTNEEASRLICNNSISKNSTTIVVDQLIQSRENCHQLLNLNLHSNSVSKLTISCTDIVFHEKDVEFTNLTSLSITFSSLQYFPTEFIALNSHLKLLNLSHNLFEYMHFTSFKYSSSLKVLDISYNRISSLLLEADFATLTQLYTQNNLISDFSDLAGMSSLSLLDVSFNPVSFEKSKFNQFHQIDHLVLQSVPALKKASLCSSLSSCKVLPPNLSVLDLSNNSLFSVPSCNGLLSGLQDLQVLTLNDNRIAFIESDIFRSTCFANLSVLSLHNNNLLEIDSGLTASLFNLQTLILTKNYLQHISVSIIKKFDKLHSKKLPSISNYPVGLFLDKNSWSCDCFQKQLQHYLITHNVKISIVCQIPNHLRGKDLKNIQSSSLTCKNASLSVDSNLTTTFEYQDATLVCRSYGIPKPIVSWSAPDGTVISHNSLSLKEGESSLYVLSGYGEKLTVKNVRLSKTGVYRCSVNNNISKANSTVGLSVVLSNVSTIVYLVITCISFLVAIILNSVNMFRYIHHYIKLKREYKRALAEVEKEEKINPPIRHRSRSNIDESMASLNANKHYGKYDFTCQQMFLDTVIKGAHTVKKTLYDARHSEFSNNMWEYAASLRDRLHIELPTQLPTISMPNISMPSIPTMQDINTNIERLGSSVMTRSHNLASSVGSVFTLKRWMWQQPAESSSDGESKSSDENLDKSELTRVHVDVHSSRLDGRNKASDDDDDDDDEAPLTSRQSEKRESREKLSRLLSNRCEAEVNDGCSSKSLPSYGRVRCGDLGVKSPPTKTVTFLQEESEIFTVRATPVESEILPAPVSNITDQTVSFSVENQCHSYETSV